MSLYKRNGTWWFGFAVDGKRYQQSTHQKNKNVARDMESAFRTAVVKGEVGITERKKIPGFKAAMADFLTWANQDHQMASSTADRYRYSSLALLSFFGDKSLDKITPDEVEKYKAARLNQFVTARSKDGRKVTKKPIQPATVNRELACLRAMFNHTIKSGVLLTNPISKTAAKTLHEDNEQTRVISYDEQTKYLVKATPMLRDVATIMLETGMRPEEVFRIQSENVHLAENYLFNPYGKTKAAKRRIKLTATAKSILAVRMKAAAERATEEKDSGVFLFPCETDATRPLPGIQSAHARALRESKVASFRLYDLRHTWATRAVEAGIDLVTLAAMLGHSKINMVLRYAHPTQEHQTKAMDKLEQFVAQKQIEAAELAARQQGMSEMAVQ